MLEFNGIEIPKLELPDFPQNTLAENPVGVVKIEIDEKKTIPYQIKEQTEQIIKSHQQQIELLNEQNKKSYQQIRLLSQQVEQLLIIKWT